MRLVERLRRDRAGSSAVELALLVPFLSFALVAASDLARGFSQRLDLVSAADQAAALASAPGAVRGDYTFLKAEAESAAGVPGATATIVNWLECNGVAQAATVKLCAGNVSFARYVEVDVSATYDPFFNYAGLIPSEGVTIVGSAKVRIQ